MAARHTASAMITFGLVTVPVRIFPAVSSRRVSFSMLHVEDRGRVRQHLVCSVCGKTIERRETTRGYERAPDQFVVVSDAELKAVQRKSEHSIEVQEFVPLSAVDPVYFEKSQLLGPDKAGHKPYLLLTQAMQRTEQVAVARFATRGQLQLVLLRAYDGGIIMHGLYYFDELRSMRDVPIDQAKAPRENEIALAVQLIQQLSSSEFHAEQYRDEYREAVLDLIEKKSGAERLVHAPKGAGGEKVADIVEVLQASLNRKARSGTALVKEPRRAAAQPRRMAARGPKRTPR